MCPSTLGGLSIPFPIVDHSIPYGLRSVNADLQKIILFDSRGARRNGDDLPRIQEPFALLRVPVERSEKRLRLSRLPVL